MNQADMESSLRALLAERAERAQLNPGLAEQIIVQATSPATVRQLHRPVTRRRNWVMPLLVAAAVVAAVAGVVGYLTLSDTSSGRGQSRVALGGPTKTAPPTTPVTSPAPTTSSSPDAQSARFEPVASTESHGATLVKVKAFQAADLTFVGSNIWAMGSATCIATGVGRCSALVHSTDGAHWSLLSSTPFNVGLDVNGCADPCVHNIRFATPTVGYVFGPSALFITKNAGRTWARQPGGALALETLDNNVIRVSGSEGCPPGCVYTVQTSAIGSSTWKTVSLPGTPSPDGVTLARTGSSAYLMTYGHTAGGAEHQKSTLYTSDNDGASWTNRGEVCRQNGGEVDSTAMTGGSDGSIEVTCQARVPGASSHAWVTVSSNGGTTFHTAPGTLPASLPQLVGAGTSRTICVDDGVLYCSQDSGATFSLAKTSHGGPSKVSWLGFENQTDGRALEVTGSGASTSSNLWTTRDGGASWTLTLGIG